MPLPLSLSPVRFLVDGMAERRAVGHRKYIHFIVAAHIISF